jgi:hypothetical protein
MQIVLQLQLFPQTRAGTRLPEGEERSKYRKEHKIAEAIVKSDFLVGRERSTFTPEVSRTSPPHMRSSREHLQAGLKRRLLFSLSWIDEDQLIWFVFSSLPLIFSAENSLILQVFLVHLQTFSVMRLQVLVHLSTLLIILEIAV